MLTIEKAKNAIVALWTGPDVPVAIVEGFMSEDPDGFTMYVKAAPQGYEQLLDKIFEVGLEPRMEKARGVEDGELTYKVYIGVPHGWRSALVPQ